MKHIQKIFAFLFLLAFLFASSGKTVHVLIESDHEHDFICFENATHFHEAEHSCFICDFELQLSDEFNFNSPEIAINIILKEEVSNSIYFVFSETHFSFTSRGPPAA